MTYLAIIAIIGLLITVHEFGHFLVARWLGQPVEVFAVGFGPALWSFQWGETRYQLGAIPLGGYVQLQHEDEADYFRIPVGRRIFYLLGGPAANVLIAVPLFAVMNVLLDGFTAYGMLIAPLLQTGQTMLLMLLAIPALFFQPEQVSGVVGIVHLGGDFIGMSPVRALHFSALLSLNLAILNLLPVPPLDGGKIALHALEAIHPRAKRLLIPVSVVGLLLLLGLMLYATVLDVTRLI